MIVCRRERQRFASPRDCYGAGPSIEVKVCEFGVTGHFALR